MIEKPSALGRQSDNRSESPDALQLRTPPDCALLDSFFFSILLVPFPRRLRRTRTKRCGGEAGKHDGPDRCAVQRHGIEGETVLTPRIFAPELAAIWQLQATAATLVLSAITEAFLLSKLNKPHRPSLQNYALCSWCQRKLVDGNV
ncbi:hypothetical protein V5799_016507 [Amblyomma americanum]|uniref:Uncharacterized protein n=1 Tax=Amblyomma americanum TaxID=6943 RepID=A0AAQ4F5J1_AMBAM